MCSRRLQEPAVTIPNDEMHFEESLSYDNATDDVLPVEKVEDSEDDDFMGDTECSRDDTVASTAASTDSLTEQHRRFVTMCREELESDSLPMGFDRWTVKEQHDHLISNIDVYFPNIPESLRFVLPASFKNGDCGRSASERPDWLDIDKFRRGQRFALHYFSVLSLSHLLGLLQVFNFTDGLKPLILSQRSNTPYRAFKRYLSTINRFKNWYMSDPWCEGTQAYRDIQAVRRMHRVMRRKLCNMDDTQIDLASETPQMRCPALGIIEMDFADACPMIKSWQCPYTMMRNKGLNQGDMSGTQFACMGLVLTYPEQFGVYASEEDWDAFCHLWRGLGYLLGIEDQYNFCRGSLPDVRQRAQDMIEHWVKPNLRMVTSAWEHMAMCLYEGVSGVVYLSGYKVFLLWLCDMFKLAMPRLYDSLSITEKMLYGLRKYVLFYVVKLPGAHVVANALFQMFLNRAAHFGPKEHDRLKKRSSRLMPKFTSM